jgi:RNA polymerase sigma-70 factor (ECF subfamily)
MDDSLREAQWRRWLQEHAPRFVLFARQKARSEADAQDLVQEALAEALKRVGNQGLPSPSLVYATIRRRAIDFARQEDRRAARELAAMEHAPAYWFDSGLEEQEFKQVVTGAMNGIPDIYREVVTLKVWGELTFAEIGETLGIPANTAASRYRYGLEELRRLTRKVLV